MSEMATMRKVEPHETVMRSKQRCVDSKVCRAARERLDVDSPFLRVETERRQRALDAQALVLVSKLVAAVIARPRVPLAVFVRQPRGQRIAHSPRADVLLPISTTTTTVSSSTTRGWGRERMAKPYLGCNHLKALALATLLLGSDGVQFGIGLSERTRPLCAFVCGGTTNHSKDGGEGRKK